MKSNNRKILFISPTWVGIHEDVSLQLERMGFEVTFISENSIPEDSLRIKGKKIKVSRAIEEFKKNKYWIDNSDIINKSYDYLLVIDGQGINEYLFKVLKSSNPNIYCINYLYDTTHSVYHFEKNFSFFDKIFTFDRHESEKYNINLLPIYWPPIEDINITCKYDIFGFGAYSKNRYDLFKFIKDIANDLDKRTFIKVYHNKIKSKFRHVVNTWFRKFMGKDTLISIANYKTDLISHTLLSTTEFRSMIQSSDVIIDSKVLEQDGLTARFMWALGAEKKIITTNAAARLYPFYSESQILILDESLPLESQTDSVKRFLEVPSIKLAPEIRNIIDSFRIDKWINTLLSKT